MRELTVAQQGERRTVILTKPSGETTTRTTAGEFRTMPQLYTGGMRDDTDVVRRTVPVALKTMLGTLTTFHTAEGDTRTRPHPDLAECVSSDPATSQRGAARLERRNLHVVSALSHLQRGGELSGTLALPREVVVSAELSLTTRYPARESADSDARQKLGMTGRYTERKVHKQVERNIHAPSLLRGKRVVGIVDNKDGEGRAGKGKTKHEIATGLATLDDEGQPRSEAIKAALTSSLYLDGRARARDLPKDWQDPTAAEKACIIEHREAFLFSRLMIVAQNRAMVTVQINATEAMEVDGDPDTDDDESGLKQEPFGEAAAVALGATPAQYGSMRSAEGRAAAGADGDEDSTNLNRGAAERDETAEIPTAYRYGEEDPKLTRVLLMGILNASSKHWQNAAYIVEKFITIFEEYDGCVHAVGSDQEIASEILRAVLHASSDDCPDHGARALPLLAIVGGLHSIKNMAIGTLKFYYQSTLKPALTAAGYPPESSKLHKLMQGSPIRDSRRELMLVGTVVLDVLAETFFDSAAGSVVEKHMLASANRAHVATLAAEESLNVQTRFVTDCRGHVTAVQLTAEDEMATRQFDTFIKSLPVPSPCGDDADDADSGSGSAVVGDDDVDDDDGDDADNDDAVVQAQTIAAATSAAECVQWLNPMRWSATVLIASKPQLQSMLVDANVSVKRRVAGKRGAVGIEILRGRAALMEAGATAETCLGVTHALLHAGLLVTSPKPADVRPNILVLVQFVEDFVAFAMLVKTVTARVKRVIPYDAANPACELIGMYKVLLQRFARSPQHSYALMVQMFVMQCELLKLHNDPVVIQALFEDIEDAHHMTITGRQDRTDACDGICETMIHEAKAVGTVTHDSSVVQTRARCKSVVMIQRQDRLEAKQRKRRAEEGSSDGPRRRAAPDAPPADGDSDADESARDDADESNSYGLLGGETTSSDEEINHDVKPSPEHKVSFAQRMQRKRKQVAVTAAAREILAFGLQEKREGSTARVTKEGAMGVGGIRLHSTATLVARMPRGRLAARHTALRLARNACGGVFVRLSSPGALPAAVVRTKRRKNAAAPSAELAACAQRQQLLDIAVRNGKIAVTHNGSAEGKYGANKASSVAAAHTVMVDESGAPSNADDAITVFEMSRDGGYQQPRGSSMVHLEDSGSATALLRSADVVVEDSIKAYYAVSDVRVRGGQNDGAVTMRVVAMALHMCCLKANLVKNVLLISKYDRHALIPEIRKWITHSVRGRAKGDAAAAESAYVALDLDDRLDQRGPLAGLFNDMGFRARLEIALHETAADIHHILRIENAGYLLVAGKGVTFINGRVDAGTPGKPIVTRLADAPIRTNTFKVGGMPRAVAVAELLSVTSRNDVGEGELGCAIIAKSVIELGIGSMGARGGVIGTKLGVHSIDSDFSSALAAVLCVALLSIAQRAATLGITYKPSVLTVVHPSGNAMARTLAHALDGGDRVAPARYQLGLDGMYFGEHLVTMFAPLMQVLTDASIEVGQSARLMFALCYILGGMDYLQALRLPSKAYEKLWRVMRSTTLLTAVKTDPKDLAPFVVSGSGVSTTYEINPAFVVLVFEIAVLTETTGVEAQLRKRLKIDGKNPDGSPYDPASLINVLDFNYEVLCAIHEWVSRKTLSAKHPMSRLAILLRASGASNVWNKIFCNVVLQTSNSIPPPQPATAESSPFENDATTQFQVRRLPTGNGVRTGSKAVQLAALSKIFPPPFLVSGCGRSLKLVLGGARDDDDDNNIVDIPTFLCSVLTNGVAGQEPITEVKIAEIFGDTAQSTDVFVIRTGADLAAKYPDPLQLKTSVACAKQFRAAIQDACKWKTNATLMKKTIVQVAESTGIDAPASDELEEMGDMKFGAVFSKASSDKSSLRVLYAVLKHLLRPDAMVPEEVTEIQDEWAQCNECGKWRRLPSDVDAEALPEPWVCALATWTALTCEMDEGGVSSGGDDSVGSDMEYE